MKNRVAHNKGKFKNPLGPSHSWIDRFCEECGAMFRTQVRTIERGGGRFCSKTCNPSYPTAAPKRIRARKHNLKSKYGITEEDFQLLNEQQGGVCAICGEPPVWKHGKLLVDHCHETKSVRALLCVTCNLMLGSSGDSPAVLRRAAEYIETHRNRAAVGA